MRTGFRFILAAVLGAAASSPAQVPPKYIPQPVYCANGTGTLCAVIPSFIGSDPALSSGFGYQGLSNHVTSAGQDVQTPFDNMSWQMFVALNWQASQAGGDPKTGLSGQGPVLWQTYARPEDVFGGPAGVCANPDNLPRFNLIAKSDAQGSRDEEFIQATGQPLIDVNGNWTLFERRLNGVEQSYIEGHALDSLAGQQVFALSGNTVSFPPGQMTPPSGQPGAIEMKASWRIVSAAEAKNYFSIQALLDVEGKYVSGGQPLCATVTLGLVGLHIIQANVQEGNLLPQFIWASFEHVGNAPAADAACDATDPNCYKNIASSGTSPNLCPATQATGTYSFFNTACTSLETNAPPVLAPGQSDFLWNPTPPYAQAYTTSVDGTLCGTQATHCWQVYSLTQQLNSQWQEKLRGIGSVFANYYLIGTNWGGNVEPDGTQLTNGSVPAFLGNSTMETYIQSDPQFGNCVDCHKGATLAYVNRTDPSKPISYDADFSFLLGLATATCTDVGAGPIWNNADAQQKCPTTCSKFDLRWNGQWTTTVPGSQSVCGCCLASSTSTK